MPAGNALVNVREGQPHLGSEADVRGGGIVQRAVDAGGDLEADNRISTAWTLKNIGEGAVPDGASGATLGFHIAGRAGDRHKHLEIVLLPASDIPPGVGGIDIRVLRIEAALQILIVPDHFGCRLQRGRRGTAVPDLKGRHAGSGSPGSVVEIAINDNVTDAPLGRVRSAALRKTGGDQKTSNSY